MELNTPDTDIKSPAPSKLRGMLDGVGRVLVNVAAVYVAIGVVISIFIALFCAPYGPGPGLGRGLGLGPRVRAKRTFSDYVSDFMFKAAVAITPVAVALYVYAYFFKK